MGVRAAALKNLGGLLVGAGGRGGDPAPAAAAQRAASGLSLLVEGAELVGDVATWTRAAGTAAAGGRRRLRCSHCDAGLALGRRCSVQAVTCCHSP